MGCKPIAKMRRRRSRRPNARLCCRVRRGSRSFGNGGDSSSKVSDKLEALRSLVPVHNGDIQADQLFQETADYIVLLRKQVVILQRLIQFYGSGHEENAV